MGVFSVARLTAPRFRGAWLPPPGLARGADFLREYRVLLLTAIAGSGKTRFMAQLSAELHEASSLCCWLRISSDMASEQALARALATVLVRQCLGEHSATAALLAGAGDAMPRSLISVALNEIARKPDRIILFVDDLQHLHAPDAVSLLQLLLDDAPQNLRLVLASRARPPLRLAKLKMDGELCELRADSFEIGLDQIGELVVAMGLPRPELAELRALSNKTQGWVAGVQLCCRNNRTRQHLAMAEPFLLGSAAVDYFEQELLAPLSPQALQALDRLLRPHSLDRRLLLELCGGDAAAAQAILDEYEACALFTRTSQQGRVYYKAAPLLDKIVRERSLMDERAVQSLHRRCCDWFEAHDDLHAAAAHAIECGDIERAVDLIDRCGMDMIALGNITDLQKWLPHLPMALLRRRPMALLAVAWAMSLLYRLDEAWPFVVALEDETRHLDAESAAGLRSSVDALKVMHLSMRDQLGPARTAIVEWRRQYGGGGDSWPAYVVDNAMSFVLAHLGEVDLARAELERAYLPNFFAEGPYAAIYSRCILGLIDLRDGQVRRAEVHFSWALKSAQTVSATHSTAIVMAAGLLAGARHERNDPTGVRELTDSYAWSMHEHLFTDARFQAYRAMARDQAQRRFYRRVMSSLEQILDAGPAVSLRRMKADVLAEKFFVALQQNDYSMARLHCRVMAAELAEVPPGDDVHRLYLETTLAGCRAHLALVTGHAHDAIAPLRQCIRQDMRTGWKLRAFSWAILLVRALWLDGRQALALRLMARLVNYAAPAGIVRSVLDGGADIALVLNQLVTMPGFAPDRRTARYVQHVRQAFDPGLALVEKPASDTASQAQPALTAREMELIRLVRGGMTNRQIAQRMLVSENTVKWHLKNVFEKLNVTRRAELARVRLA